MPSVYVAARGGKLCRGETLQFSLRRLNCGKSAGRRPVGLVALCSRSRLRPSRLPDRRLHRQEPRVLLQPQHYRSRGKLCRGETLQFSLRRLNCGKSAGRRPVVSGHDSASMDPCLLPPLLFSNSQRPPCYFTKRLFASHSYDIP
jgi:hypothetical protein